jgi:hypothetical protein
MAVPRPVLLVLVGLGLIASVFLVTRSGTNQSVSGPSKQAVEPAVAPSPPARPSKARAQKPAAPAARATHPAAPAKPAVPAPAKPVVPAVKAPAGLALPARVLAAAKALGENKAVVFFFSAPGPADDVGARLAVHSLRGMPRVEIFDASLDEVAAYRPMLSNVGISQVPSTVIVRPGKKAVLFQGFVDAGTLRQNVADALR